MQETLETAWLFCCMGNPGHLPASSAAILIPYFLAYITHTVPAFWKSAFSHPLPSRLREASAYPEGVIQKKRAPIWLECDWRRLPIFCHISESSCAESRVPYQTHRAVTCDQHSRRISPLCSFLLSPLGQRHHKVDWVLIIYWGTKLSEGKERVATQKPMDGAQLFCLFLDVGIAIFEGPGHAVLFVYFIKISLPWKQEKPNSSLFW